jgi:hypothetical protein
MVETFFEVDPGVKKAAQGARAWARATIENDDATWRSHANPP